MRSLNLHFTGPLTFVPGPNYLFDSALQNVSCVYLWTIQSKRDGRHYIHYVGEAQSFAKRQREHLIHILGLNYGIFDPIAAQQGVLRAIWPGLWRDKSVEGPARLVKQYSTAAQVVLDYLAALNVFVAQLDADATLRRHVEGAIAWNLRNKHKDSKMLYPDDNHVTVSREKRALQLVMSTDEAIAGLDSALEI